MSKFFSIPFTGQSSFILQKTLYHLKDDIICVSFWNFNTFGPKFFSRLKDPTPLGERTDLVYRIPCSSCSKFYVRETLQHLEKRINRHRYDESKLNDETALAVHAKSTTGHCFDFDKTSILVQESNTRKRKIREVIVIEIINSNTVNFKRDSAKLTTMYGSVINNS